MANQRFWTNVAVKMAATSNITAGRTVTAISKASPAVVTYTGTDPANGNYVLLEAAGMTQVNNRLFRVAAVNTGAKTFQLEGVDSTTYGTFSAGTFKVVTFAIDFSTLYNPSASGGDEVTEDTTLIHDSEDSTAVVSSSAQQYGFSSVWDPSDPALIECRNAFVERTKRPFMVQFSDGARYLFFATVNAPLSPQQDGRKVSTNISLRLQGSGTTYAS